MWIPHEGPQTDFCSRGEFEVLFGGAAGPGKTDCLIALPLRHIKHPGFRGLLLRRTFPNLQEIIDRCYAKYPEFGGVYRSTEHRWYFPSGAIINLGHMQHEADKYNYQGKEFHFIGFDELTQFTESQYLYLFSRARSTNPDIHPRIRSTTNPGGIGHNWVKERFVSREWGKTHIDKNTGLSRAFINATIEDNPTLFDNDPGYLARLESLPEVEKQRLRHGIWDAFEGQVFPELSMSVHGCEPFDIPPEWEKYCLLDWGYAKPFSVAWYAVDYDGVIYRYREWYGTGKKVDNDSWDVGQRLRADEVAQGILDREKETVKYRIADPSIWHKRPSFRKGESLGPTIHEDFTRCGVHFLKADNDRIQGKQQVHKRLALNEDIDKETGEVLGTNPSVQIFNTCQHFWRVMQAIVEDPKNPEDVDTKQEDHIYDEFRYMCMARPIRAKHKPKEPTGSFQHERSKLIRARKYAKSRGVSLEVAYSRMR